MTAVSPAGGRTHDALMDAVYRNQRHIYDATRKYFLLGRDRLIDGLDAKPGMAVLEIACGTGRNLVRAAQRYPDARFFGLDISAEMLKSARGNIARAGLSDRVVLAQADATAFDPQALFGVDAFDRVFLSYALSMIPPWEDAVGEALRHVAPGGALHVVDFGGQEGLPGWFRTSLTAWLARFHVMPRDELGAVLGAAAETVGGAVRVDSLHRGYARHGVISCR